jgi:formylglycine-generating enzyme
MSVALRILLCGGRMLALACLPLAWLQVSYALADAFGSGIDSFSIDFVTIGRPGNLPDTTGVPNPAGSVPYAYRIGKYEISEQMIDKANALGGLGIIKDSRGPDKPVTRVSWFEAAKFVNWLNTSTGSAPAYKFDAAGEFQLWTPADAGYTAANLFRNSEARYFLPSADEWYKAAFYDPATGIYLDFPNGSNLPPMPVASGTAPNTAVYDQPFVQGPADIMLAGGASPFGTVAQAGNVWEWEETAVDLVNDSPQENRGFRGDNWSLVSGDYSSLSSSFRYFIQPPGNSIGDTGFRVASVIPEPSSALLSASVLLLPFVLKRRRQKV